MIEIIIAICTYKRNEKLRLLLNSLYDMNIKKEFNIRIIIVDNDADNNSIDSNFLKKYKEKYSIDYIKESKKGISNARNRCIVEAKKYYFDYFLFLDDDEIVDSDWLNKMIKCKINYDADVVRGSVITTYSNNIKTYIVKSGFFDREIKKTGEKLDSCACGNVLIGSNVILETGICFKEEYNFSGGEDTDFFYEVLDNGYKIVWCQEGKVFEDLSDERNNLKFIFCRSLNNGYNYLKIQRKRKKINLIIEFVKNFILLMIYIIISILFNVLNLKVSINSLAKTLECLGKLINIFNIKLDGVY